LLPSDILLAPTLTRQPATRIQICGRLAVEIAGRTVTELIPRRQGRVLFTYLVVNRHQHASRDEMVEGAVAGRLSSGRRWRSEHRAVQAPQGSREHHPGGPQ
jgi:hypothetical protein